MFQTDILLPDKLSDLLTLGMKDYRTTMADPRYKINMSRWHTRQQADEPCHVCLAGSVVAQTLQFPIDQTLNIREDVTFDVRTKMHALDFLRNGDVEEAYRILHGIGEDDPIPKDLRSALAYHEMPSRHEDRDQWEKDLDRLALDLAAVGL